MNNKFLALTIASIMSLNVLPVNVFRKIVQAEIAFKSNVNKIEEPVAGGENGEWKGNYVYFGSYPQSLKEGADEKSKDPNDFKIEPIKWRVLDPNNAEWTGSTPTDNGFAYNIGYGDETGGRQNAPVGSSGMLLYSDKALDAKQYHSTYTGNEEENKLCWGGSGKGCTLWAWLNRYDNANVLKKSETEDSTIPEDPFIDKAFEKEEQAAIMDTKVYSEDLYNDRKGATDPDHKRASSPRTSLTTDKIFLPSYNEILNESYGFTNTCSSLNTRSFGFSNYSNNLKSSPDSWLRSPGNLDDNASAATLCSDGNVYYLSNVHNAFGVAPALNLNLTSVILASEAAGSGASDTEGGGKKSSAVSSIPARFELPTGTGNAYKLTLHDSSRDDFTAEKTAQNGNEITISYGNAKTGENEYISCMIVDEQSEIKYYGKLAEAESESGEVKLTLPEEFEAEKYLVVMFNEKCHEGNETDLSNWPSVFEVTVEKAVEPSDPTTSEKPSTNDWMEKINFSYYEPSTGSSQVIKPSEPESKIIFTLQSDEESVKISNGETKKIKYKDAEANITLKKSGEDIEIEIKDENGQELNVESKIVLIIGEGNYKSATVAKTSDGKIIRKSVAKDSKLYVPLNSSMKFKIIDNAKTFSDVSNHWASDAIDFVSSHELFIGTVPNIFEPETTMSRAMLAQVLYNLEGNPNQNVEEIFDDVKSADWFAKAITWAVRNNFMTGYDDRNFAPNDDITREQLATILYRYFGENEIVDIDLDFKNADQITDYALKAMKWAVKYGVVQGKGDKILDPSTSATRAQVAQMFQNLMLKLFN